MKNRDRQREERRIKNERTSREEMLDLRDYCNVEDTTPYLAVRNMIRNGDSAADGLHRFGGVVTMA